MPSSVGMVPKWAGVPIRCHQTMRSVKLFWEEKNIGGGGGFGRWFRKAVPTIGDSIPSTWRSISIVYSAGISTCGMGILKPYEEGNEPYGDLGETLEEDFEGHSSKLLPPRHERTQKGDREVSERCLVSRAEPICSPCCSNAAASSVKT